MTIALNQMDMLIMNCPHCGKVVKDGASFCVFCGGKIAMASASPTPSTPAPVRISCTAGEHSGKQFTLTREGVTVGRDPSSCQIVLNSPEISRKNTWIGLDDSGRPTVRDLGSSNGTFLNENKISQTLIGPGDILRLGITSRTTFSLESQAAPKAAPGMPKPPMPVAGAAVQDLANRTISEMVGTKVSKPRLQLVIDHYVVESYLINEQGILIGRDPGSCTILLDHPSISRVHARVVHKGGMVLLKDEGSANGTFVDGKRIQEHVLAEGNVITFGAYHDKSLIFRDSRVDAHAFKSLKLDRDQITIGRDAGNDVVLDHPMVSSFHAKILRTQGNYLISDLGSLNGTHVNGRKIQTQPLQPRDRITIAGFELKFDGDQVQHDSRISGVSIDAYALNKVVGGNLLLLDNISLAIQPNEFVGLLGPSGAGKSTLMDALNGFRPATSGTVLINDIDLYGSYESLNSLIGYVPQDDIIHRQLSVYKCLYYAARLRLPLDTPEGEIEGIINDVLKTLELEERRHTLVSALSGGQRKRVNIGVELVTRPSLLFLDEPTSGLDPRTEAKMMALFRQLADQGRTLLLTTHVMASLTQLDKITVLIKGKLAYFGPGPDLLEYFSVESPGDTFDKLETSSPEDWKERYKQSPYYKQYVVEPLAAKEKSRQAAAPKEKGPAKRKSNGLFQFKVLSQRYSEIKFNDRIFTAILLLQAPLLAGLMTLVTKANGGMILFLIVFGAVWYGFTNATREIVGEQAIYKRERQTGIKVPSYIFSKIGILTLICLAQCLLTLGTLSVLGHIEGRFAWTLIVMLLVSVNGMLLGLLVSASVKSTELAITFGVVALFPQILLAGLMQPIGDINQISIYKVTAREAAQRENKPVPEGALGDVVVRTMEVPVKAISGMSTSVELISRAVVARWGLEALSDIYREEKDRNYPGKFDEILSIRNNYIISLVWLTGLAVLVGCLLLYVQKSKDGKS
jgi:ABC transport system ATP-binding/permease protein